MLACPREASRRATHMNTTCRVWARGSGSDDGADWRVIGFAGSARHKDDAQQPSQPNATQQRLDKAVARPSWSVNDPPLLEHERQHIPRPSVGYVSHSQIFQPTTFIVLSLERNHEVDSHIYASALRAAIATCSVIAESAQLSKPIFGDAMVLHSGVELRTSAIAGRGLYATEVIPAGALIWRADAGDAEKFYKTKAEIEAWSADEQRYFFNFAYQVAPGIYSGVQRCQEADTDKSQFMNHCCEPNTAFRGDEEMVAVRDIAPGDEVTYDYATSEHEGSFHLPFACSCGAGTCRKAVAPEDWSRPDLQERYAGRFTSAVQELITGALVKAEKGA